jgi:murein DD-endopeptidase MepM/ murein hydrolase activator NlpD
MVSEKGNSFFIKYAVLITVVALMFGVATPLHAIGDPAKDSLTSGFVKLPVEKQRTAIQKMNKRQLITLVDYLFGMEKVPVDLLHEIDLAVANLKEDESHNASLKNNVSFPAADFYVSWEIDKLFPEEDLLKLEGDTSITLNLMTEGQNDYHHPFNGPITSMFGWRDSREHKGIDIDLDKGDAVGAAFDGMVRVARMYGGFGNVVIIRHYNGLETVYAHLSKIKVEPGQLISAGDVIGLGGNTGHSRGSHLHFEVRFKGVPINPKYMISLCDQKLLCNQLTIKQTKWGLAAYPKDAKVYTVEKGDTFWGIAKQFGTTTSYIKKLNADCVRLQAGQLINVAQ